MIFSKMARAGGQAGLLRVSRSMFSISSLASARRALFRFRKSRLDMVPSKLINSGYRKAPVAIWLLSTAFLVLLMIGLGGYTRLSNSGLSMVRWKPVGYHYPMTEEEWEKEFSLYKQYPEYEFRPHMSLSEFKEIFNVEYAHRLFGNVLGGVFGLPMIYFWARGYFTPAMKRRTGILLLLGGLQGLVGWWMVKSGLKEKAQYHVSPKVSTYRLIAHNLMAIFLYSTLLFTGLSIWVKPMARGEAKPIFRYALVLVHLAACNLISGAAAAGIDAGSVYNTWPRMNGKFIPKDYWKPQLGLRNFFENRACVQFNHRMFGYITYTSVMLMYYNSLQKGLPFKARFAMFALLLLVNFQLINGVHMVVTQVTVDKGMVHQSTGLMVWSFIIFLLAIGKR